MDAYLVDVTEILHDLGASVDIDTELPATDFAMGETRFVATGPLVVTGIVTNAGDGLVASGNVDTDFETDCSRCLEPFRLHLTGEIEGFYTTPEKATELPEEQEWEPLGDGVIDLAAAIEAAVRIALPFVPLCAEECPGLCPTCGKNLKEGACDCEPAEPVGSPFDVLKGMFDGQE